MKNLQEMISERELRMLDISLLEDAGDRLDESEDSLSFLDMSIEDSGLLEPLTVAGPYPNGKYRVICGVRRLHALKLRYMSGLAVPCYVVTDGNAAESTLGRMRAESHLSVRRVPEQAERLKYCENLAAEYGVGVEFVQQMKKTFECSDRYCRQFRNVVVNGSEFLKMFLCMGGKLRIGEAARIANAAPDNEELQRQLVDDFLERKDMKRKLYAQKTELVLLKQKDEPEHICSRSNEPVHIQGEKTAAAHIQETPDVPEHATTDTDAENAVVYMRRLCQKGKVNMPTKTREALLTLCGQLSSMYGEVQS